jgi:hypothetical protein
MNDDVDIVAWQKTRSELPPGREEKIRVQLTARCAGFLEVSYRSQQGQFVSYFHRTARDFLETQTCRSKFSMQTISTHFDPNLAIMRSCIRSLQLQPLINPHDSKSNEKRSAVIKISEDFMIYAHHAESHIQSGDLGLY